MRRRMVIIGVAMVLLFLGHAGVGLAQNQAGSFAISPFLGGYIFDGKQDLKHGMTFGLGLGYNLTENWGGAALFNYIDTDSKAGTAR